MIRSLLRRHVAVPMVAVAGAVSAVLAAGLSVDGSRAQSPVAPPSTSVAPSPGWSPGPVAPSPVVPSPLVPSTPAGTSPATSAPTGSPPAGSSPGVWSPPVVSGADPQVPGPSGASPPAGGTPAPGGVVPTGTTPPPAGSGGSGPVTKKGYDASMDEMLQRDKAPPEGVAAQHDFFLGGSQDCVATGGPPEVLVDETAVIPSAVKLCLVEWDPASPVQLKVTTPAGRTHTMAATVDVNLERQVLYPLAPGNSEGRYKVEARQGDTVTVALFSARRTDRPVMAVAPVEVVPGTPVDVFLGGLPPKMPTAVHLYSCEFKSPGGTHKFEATQAVTTDDAGAAHIVIRTTASTPENCYVVQSEHVLHPRSGSKVFIPVTLRKVWESRPRRPH